MQWVKLHTESRNDAKLRSLSDAEFRVWFNLLCLAGDQEQRGVVRFARLAVLAVEVAAGDERLLEAALAHFADLDMIRREKNQVDFTHWAKRQYDRPSARPEAVRERVRKHRAAKGNAHVTRGNAIDTDTDTDTDTERDQQLQLHVAPHVRESAEDTLNRQLTAQVIVSAGLETGDADLLADVVRQRCAAKPWLQPVAEAARCRLWVAAPAQRRKGVAMSVKLLDAWLDRARPPAGMGQLIAHAPSPPPSSPHGPDDCLCPNCIDHYHARGHLAGCWCEEEHYLPADRRRQVANEWLREARW